MRQLFAPFGTISSIEIMKDMSGQSQGYGYVEFTSMPDASKAMQQWDGQEVVGQKLSVKVATMGGQPGAVTLPQLDLDDDEGIAASCCDSIALAASVSAVLSAMWIGKKALGIHSENITDIPGFLMIRVSDNFAINRERGCLLLYGLCLYLLQNNLACRAFERSDQLYTLQPGTRITPCWHSVDCQNLLCIA